MQREKRGRSKGGKGGDRVGVVWALEDAGKLQPLPSQAVTREGKRDDHAQQSVWLVLHHLAVGHFLEASGASRVPAAEILVELLARDGHLFDVCNDDVVPHDLCGVINGLVLAENDPCDLLGYPAHDLALAIDMPPPAERVVLLEAGSGAVQDGGGERGWEGSFEEEFLAGSLPLLPRHVLRRDKQRGEHMSAHDSAMGHTERERGMEERIQIERVRVSSRDRETRSGEGETGKFLIIGGDISARERGGREREQG
jgi:hypothetical protein